jgi:hypothetical protein
LKATFPSKKSTKESWPPSPSGSRIPAKMPERNLRYAGQTSINTGFSGFISFVGMM